MRKFIDIHPPKSKIPKWSRKEAPVFLLPSVKKIEEPKPKSHFKMSVSVTLVIFLLLLGFYGLNILDFRNRAKSLAPVILSKFQEAANSLKDLELENAKRSFQSAASDIDSLNAQAAKIIPYFKSVPAALEDLGKIGKGAVALSGELENIQRNALSWIVNKNGNELLDSFARTQSYLQNIIAPADDLKNQAANLGYALDNDLLAVNSRLTKGAEFLDSFLGWLAVNRNRHLLILFQNPSEIRPGGGFIGSYAHAALLRGSLISLDVQDIYNPDGQLDLKIIPPKPLQLITTRWGARDANWFFDFSASARKVMQFLEASKFYQDRLVKFSGALAINIELIRDILEVVGPIELEEYQLTVNKENILEEIQREVEDGKDKRAGDPKKILKVLTPKLFEKIAGLDESQKKNLLKILRNSFQQKDIMVYFKDALLEDYVRESGLAGESANLPNDFVGGYLAVVNANVGGGKSDAFVEQNVRFDSKLGGDGRIENKVVVERTHRGQDRKEWWYRAANKNYLQILSPLGAKLIGMTGGVSKAISPPANYQKSGYVSDSDLAAIERSGSMFGKTIFARWLDIKPGEQKSLEVNYANPGTAKVRNGLVYQFIFDKQSGVNGKLAMSVEAPPGYVWQESGQPIFEYSIENPPARIVLNLTLAASRR